MVILIIVVEVRTGIIEVDVIIIKTIVVDTVEDLTTAIKMITLADINSNIRIPTIPLVIVDGLNVSQKETTINTTIDHKTFLEAAEEDKTSAADGRTRRDSQMRTIPNWVLVMSALNKNCLVQQILESISVNTKTYPWKRRDKRLVFYNYNKFKLTLYIIKIHIIS